jgi:hypothetical protein
MARVFLCVLTLRPDVRFGPFAGIDAPALVRSHLSTADNTALASIPLIWLNHRINGSGNTSQTYKITEPGLGAIR